jgi:hypothetical protein
MASLATIRQQYPQYANMTDAQLAQALHAKFYRSMPFDQFAAKVGLSTNPITGAMATFNRSVPGFDEAADALNAVARRVEGQAPTLADAWAQSRASSQSQADAFAAAHPHIAAIAKGMGGALQAAPILATGGAAAVPEAAGGGGLLDSLTAGARGALGLDVAPAAAPARGLLAGAKTVGRNAATGATLAGANAFANTNGDLATRNRALVSALPEGAVVGGVAPLAVKGAGMVADAAMQGGMTATQRAVAKAAAILKARAPDAATLTAEDIPEGQFPFQQMGGGGKSLARAVAATPGPGQDQAEAALRARSAQAGDRVMSQMQDSLGAGRSDYYPQQAATIAERKATADPLYEASANTPVNEVDFQQLMGPILNTDIGQKALSSAQRIAEAQSAITGKPMTWDQNIIDNGQVVGAKTPSAPMLDLISQGWDEALRPFYAGGRLSAEGRTMLQLRNAFVDKLGELVPANAEARAAWKQGSDVLDAMQTGRDIVRKQTDPELVQQATQGLTPDQQTAQNTGMAYEIAGKLRGANPQAYFRQLDRDQTAQDRLRAGFPPGDDGDTAFSSFMDAVRQEADQQATHNAILAGSRTVPLSQDVEAANAAGSEPDALTTGVSAADATRKFLKAPVSNSIALALKGVSGVKDRPLADPEVSDQLGKVLFGDKAPADLFAEADQATPASLLDKNQMLKAISFITRANAAGANPGQGEPPPPDLSWMQP